MKKQYIFILFALLCSIISFGQNGNIQGSIIDEKGLSIPFANVVIESLKKGTISDADGHFTFVGLPSGKQTLKVMYLGYADKDVELNIADGVTSSVSITIIPETEELDGIIITGYNSGQAKALNAQKNKQNITNIVSTDQIGKFPDANIGDAVKRIPGITMQVDQGEARNIIIRGLAPQLNSVTLNGSRIPSAEGDNRNIQMDLIPSDMIQLIEVNKAVTPDMDADALGGSVNLVTRTSPNGFRLAATGGSGINTITNRRILNGSLLLGDKSKDGKFGWMLSASINDNDFGSDNIEFEWANEAEVNDDDIEVDPYVVENDIRTYLVQRIRRSFSANFDYTFNNNHSIYVKTMYNWRDDRENRFKLRYTDIEPVFADDNVTIDSYIGVIERETKGGIDNNRNQNTRLEDQRMQNYSIGGKHLFGNVEFDWMTSFAKASEERLNERYVNYVLEEDTSGEDLPLNVNLSDTEFPVVSLTNANDNDFSTYELDEITEENQYTDEKDINSYINLKIPSNLIGHGGFLKIGGRTRFKEKQRDNNFFEIESLDGRFDNFSAISVVDQTDSNFLAGSQYAAGSFADPEFLGQQNFTNTSLFEVEDLPEEYESGNFTVKEDVYAAYIMANQQLSDKLSVLAGIRVEGTFVESQGNALEFDEDGDYVGSETVEDEEVYVHILPSVHFKYNLKNNTVLRFAWTNTLARPNYQDLVPYEEVINEDDEIVRGNSDLSATESMNFDVMAEHYFKSVGILSGGVFYKDIKDFIYINVTEQGDFDVFQPLNGGDASILGAEMSFQRQLDFLPGIAKNFSLMLNYTFLTSSAEGVKNEDGDERDDLDLPGTAPNMFNGSLAYNDKKLNVRLSANFSDDYIDEIGGNAFEDRYYNQQFLLDFNASYAINDNLRLYFDLNNITDQPLRYFQGVKTRTMQAEYYGRRITFGLKYDLFKSKN